MTNEHRKRCSGSLLTREIQIETTRHHYVPFSLAKLQRLTTVSVGEDVEGLGFSPAVVGM